MRYSTKMDSTNMDLKMALAIITTCFMQIHLQCKQLVILISKDQALQIFIATMYNL